MPLHPPGEVYEDRRARLGRVSTLVVAVIAAGSALMSSLLTSHFANATSERTAQLAAATAGDNVRKQLVGETERSRAEFLREQRRVLYSQVLQADGKFRESLHLYYLYLINKGEPSIYKNNEAEMERTYSTFGDLESEIAILGSDAALAAMSKLLDHEIESYWDVQGVRVAVEGGDPKSVKEARADVDKPRGAEVDPLDKFRRAARDDMGSK